MYDAPFVVDVQETSITESSAYGFENSNFACRIFAFESVTQDQLGGQLRTPLRDMS
jgi:hypothetical protein